MGEQGCVWRLVVIVSLKIVLLIVNYLQHYNVLL